MPARAPAAAAPMVMFTASISLAAFMHVPPTDAMRLAMLSSRPVKGNIG